MKKGGTWVRAWAGNELGQSLGREKRRSPITPQGFFYCFDARRIFPFLSLGFSTGGLWDLPHFSAKWGPGPGSQGRPNSLSLRGRGDPARQIKRNEKGKHLPGEIIAKSPEKGLEEDSSWDFISEVGRLKPLTNSFLFQCKTSRLPSPPPCRLSISVSLS